jgi:hypothetical protein
MCAMAPPAQQEPKVQQDHRARPDQPELLGLRDPPAKLEQQDPLAPKAQPA